MTSDASPSTAAEESQESADPSRQTRMSFGDHLDELRSCLIRTLLGVALGAAVTFMFGKELVQLLASPLYAAQIANGLEPRFLLLSPTTGFIVYLKVGVLSALVLTMPWALYQAWRFVASGLYTHERRFVKRLIPSSCGLFYVGVLFLYFFVLPVVLNFFIRFNREFGPVELEMPTSSKTASTDTAPPPSPASDALIVPTVLRDPDPSQPGQIWFNQTTRKLTIRTSEGIYATSMTPTEAASTMQSQFALDSYVTFVLVLALAFGIAFETPIVVFFLAWTGLVSVATMSQSRRYVLLTMIVAAAILTPPDVISQLLLAGPMYILFEVGLVVGRVAERRAETTAT